MKNSKEQIDELIKESLSQEEAKFYDELEEQNLFGKLSGVYKGKMAWLVMMMNLVLLGIFVLFVYCVIQFFNTDVTNEMIKWSTASLFCALIVSMLKLYIWNQMDKNDILRELKRLELQVATLSSRSDN